MVTSNGCTGSCSFQLAKLPVSKDVHYVFKWYASDGWFAHQLAESSSFRVLDFETILAEQVGSPRV